MFFPLASRVSRGATFPSGRPTMTTTTMTTTRKSFMTQDREERHCQVTSRNSAVRSLFLCLFRAKSTRTDRARLFTLIRPLFPWALRGRERFSYIFDYFETRVYFLPRLSPETFVSRAPRGYFMPTRNERRVPPILFTHGRVKY